MLTRKQTTEPKLPILVSFFSGELTSYTDTNYFIHLLWEQGRIQDLKKGGGTTHCFFSDRRQPRKSQKKKLSFPERHQRRKSRNGPDVPPPP